MKKRGQRLTQALATASISLTILFGILVAGPALEAYRQDQLPIIPNWEDLQVAYLTPTADNQLDAALDPAFHASELNLRIFAKPQDVIEHSKSQGLDVFIFHASSLSSLDRVWAGQQFQRGTAFVGLEIKPSELGTLVGSGQFADWSYAEHDEPFLSAVLEKRVRVPNAVTWLFSTPRQISNFKDIFGSEFVVGPRVYLYSPVIRNVVHDIDPIRLELDKLHLVKP
jgi:hypothetical protein